MLKKTPLFDANAYLKESITCGFVSLISQSIFECDAGGMRRLHITKRLASRLGIKKRAAWRHLEKVCLNGEIICADFDRIHIIYNGNKYIFATIGDPFERILKLMPVSVLTNNSTCIIKYYMNKERRTTNRPTRFELCA